MAWVHHLVRHWVATHRIEVLTAWMVVAVALQVVAR